MGRIGRLTSIRKVGLPHQPESGWVPYSMGAGAPIAEICRSSRCGGDVAAAALGACSRCGGRLLRSLGGFYALLPLVGYLLGLIAAVLLVMQAAASANLLAAAVLTLLLAAIRNVWDIRRRAGCAAIATIMFRHARNPL
jgi:hypothetical protein